MPKHTTAGDRGALWGRGACGIAGMTRRRLPVSFRGPSPTISDNSLPLLRPVESGVDGSVEEGGVSTPGRGGHFNVTATSPKKRQQARRNQQSETGKTSRNVDKYTNRENSAEEARGGRKRRNAGKQIKNQMNKYMKNVAVF
jgi:hypothetical protein